MFYQRVAKRLLIKFCRLPFHGIVYILVFNVWWTCGVYSDFIGDRFKQLRLGQKEEIAKQDHLLKCNEFKQSTSSPKKTLEYGIAKNHFFLVFVLFISTTYYFFWLSNKSFSEKWKKTKKDKIKKQKGQKDKIKRQHKFGN